MKRARLGLGILGAAVLALLAAALAFRPRPEPADPFVGLWEFWENTHGERKRYLSITRVGGEYEALRADSAYAELAAVARGHGAGLGAARLELAFPDGERFVLTLNGTNELVVSFYKPSQPEDVYFSYSRSGTSGAE